MEDYFILFSIEATRFQAMEPPLTAHQERSVLPEDALWTQMDPALISDQPLPSCVTLGMDFTFRSLSFPIWKRGQSSPSWAIVKVMALTCVK